MPLAARGIDVRLSGSPILIMVGLDDGSGNALATGTAAVRIFEWQSDGSVKQLDFADNVLKTGSITTPTKALTVPSIPDGTTTGLWSVMLTSANIANFTVGAIYAEAVTHSALPGVVIRRKWQYGSVEGDLVVNATGQTQVQYGTASGQINLAAGNLAGIMSATTGTIAAGSTASAVNVTGLPAGKTYTGHLYYPGNGGGESRKIASAPYNGGTSTYTFNFTGTAGTDDGPFSSVTTGDTVIPTPGR